MWPGVVAGQATELMAEAAEEPPKPNPKPKGEGAWDTAHGGNSMWG